jgi:polysaccharide export outer membrane protein
VLVLAVWLALPAPAEIGEIAPYRIGPGDVVDVQVWREPDLSGPHRVDEAGRLSHVLVGTVAAEGRTREELAAELKQRLEKDYLREARVIVTLKESARRKAWILGAVARPGNYPVTESTRLLDLIFAAGGLTAESKGEAEFYRMDGARVDERAPSPTERKPLERIHVDLEELLSGDLESNHNVAAGDVLVVAGTSTAATDAAAAPRVRVAGEVQRPGSYTLIEAPTALDAVLVAGGFTDFASANRARLIRGAGDGRTVLKLRLRDIVGGREGSTNVSLQDGDLIVVPESLF